uniref:Uncharacterized protein n=1 Tax=Lepeophtheirus salmonis TaxID=72036 RepID=A0A0K2UM66_LEPSM
MVQITPTVNTQFFCELFLRLAIIFIEQCLQFDVFNLFAGLPHFHFSHQNHHFGIFQTN